ncbi:TPA: hypothetical protein N0F65_009959 [Lagenidium giganteum]|uniref:Calmodulin n=1 Tax=Lagenidium giganteum TaxID=4803 RepID=A0AAV2YVY0_9STRA|nr:TPA: hypothetical protein N0F65_009959 [Lagenidium giganteum]
MASPSFVIKEGYLKKRSRETTILTNWRRRYFRLYPGRLEYLYSWQDTAAKRTITLGLDTKVTPTNDQGYPCCLVVKASASAEPFYMQAETEAEKAEWVTAIYEAARKTQDVVEVMGTTTRSCEFLLVLSPPKSQFTRVLVHMQIDAARGLIGVDYNGKSDPYCIVNLVGVNGDLIRSEEKRTDFKTDTLDPVWNVHYVLGQAVDLRGVQAIQIDIMDQNQLQRHSPLGFVRVPLSSFRMSPASMHHSDIVDRWFRVEPPVRTSKGSPTREDREAMIRNYGELHLIMHVTGPNLIDFFHSTVAAGPVAKIVTSAMDHTDNRLEVAVLAAKDLICVGPELNLSPDPFCELSLLDYNGRKVRSEAYTTSTKYRTRNPAWENEHNIFGMVRHIEEAAKLHIKVLHKDKNNRNINLGSVTINLDELSGHKIAGWYPLRPESDMVIREQLGSIHLVLCLVGESRGERKRRMLITREVTSKTHEQSVEQLELENAQYQMHDAACKLDGARIACAVGDYQARHPKFYGINGCIHHLNTQIPRAHREATTSEELFQARAGLEGQAMLEVSVVGVSNLVTRDNVSKPNPFAVLEIDPAVCIEDVKHTSAPLSPTKDRRIEQLASAAADSRNGMFSKRAQAEVSHHRTRLTKNEVRGDRHPDVLPDHPVLRVEIVSGHGLLAGDRNGYSDPYCTMSLVDRATGKEVEQEKKRTAVVSKTLNPVWQNEEFLMGISFPLPGASFLLIHVKDHNNIGRSTPLGRVQIPLHELVQASAKSTSIASQSMIKRYPLTPEPWMTSNTSNLGELCIKTEVVGDATILAEMLQRAPKGSPDKVLSFLSFSSFSSEMNATTVDAASGGATSSPNIEAFMEGADEVTATIPRGQQIRTSTIVGNNARWRKEKFAFSLSYPGMFSDPRMEKHDRYTLHLRVFGARHLLGGAGAPGKGTTPQQFHHHHHFKHTSTDAYFTVIPWPEQEFIFGKKCDLATISHLSLHVYNRDWTSENRKAMSKLLTSNELKQTVELERHQLHKLGPGGEVDDDGFEILGYDQRVLALRRCYDGGRYFPARVQGYVPFPVDKYRVTFENTIETIEDVRDLFSIDIKGKIEQVRADGQVDVRLLDGDASTKYATNVSLSQVTPVDAFTPEVEKVMARKLSDHASQQQHAASRVHRLSALKIEILSATDIPKSCVRPGCIVTLLGQKSSRMVEVNPRGELVAKCPMHSNKWSAGELISQSFPFDSTAKDVPDMQLFKTDVAMELGNGEAMKEAAIAAGGANVPLSRELENELSTRLELLRSATSVLIKIVDQKTNAEPNSTQTTIGYVKLDLASLQHGEHDLQPRLIPPPQQPYYKYIGSLFVRVTCTDSKVQKDEQRALQAKSDSISTIPTALSPPVACGFATWFQRRMQSEMSAAVTGSLFSSVKSWTRAERRQGLRASLTPTENAQLDHFHTALVAVLTRVIKVQRELQLFDNYETLSEDDMAKCRHVHTVNADSSSELLGRKLNELNNEQRRSIIVELEHELMDLAVSNAPRIKPAAGLDAKEWNNLRVARQKAIQESGGFFMQDPTTSVVFSIPCCFTGNAMISWLVRKPAVLWFDSWVAFAEPGADVQNQLLNWDDLVQQRRTDVIPPPQTPNAAVMWLQGLCDAGYIELAAETNVRRAPIFENKDDRHYRVSEVDAWARNIKKDKLALALENVKDDANAEAASPRSPRAFMRKLSSRVEDFLSGKDRAKDTTNKAAAPTVCGVTGWYERRVAIDAATTSMLSTARSMSRIERRQQLRAALTPTENLQVDDLHLALTTVMTRVVKILREVQLFDEFEVMSADDMAKFRHVHTINADMNSEWLGRLINEMKVETRKDIVVGLELELLDIAASKLPRTHPPPDMPREEWVRLRAERQKALQQDGMFFMQDRTTALVLSIPCCFTGEGMISWMLRKPKVLWDDEWTKYLDAGSDRASQRLGWRDERLKFDPDSIQAPETRVMALVWLSALCDAGYIENVSLTAGADAGNRRYHVFEDRTDKYYRLRAVELWARNVPVNKSLFPLDLVQELDCYGGEHDADAPRTFVKKLTEHVEGLLGTKNAVTSLLFSPEVKRNALLKPVAEKALELGDAQVLWDWKYCIFVPANRCLYMYENETSGLPSVIIDMSSGACRGAYTFTYDAQGGWFEIANATVLMQASLEHQQQQTTQAKHSGAHIAFHGTSTTLGHVKYVPLSAELESKLLQQRPNGDTVLEFKSPDAQSWMRALVHSGVHVDMRKGQPVVFKQLNPTVLHQKCIEYVTEFNPNDLEGSFQRLLNHFFHHHKTPTKGEHELRLKDLRGRVRNELKKTGAVDDTVLAYYGRGQGFNPPPTVARNYQSGALYSGRIAHIRTPFTEPHYRFRDTYPLQGIPKRLQTLLMTYKVTNKLAWLALPKALRDQFLLYDVEYRHANEVIIEEGLLREDIRMNDGDLDARKVEERCVDLNLVFRSSDLEDCVSRIAAHVQGKKPLGCLKIPVKTVSPHRVIDWWYPLAPENDMVQKVKLGHVRVQLRLVQITEVIRSKKVPALLGELKDAAGRYSDDPIQPFSFAASPLRFFGKWSLGGSPIKRRMMNGQANVMTRERSFIKITVLEGRKLITADFFSSDPFVQLVLLRDDKDEREEYTKLKTDVRPSTLNPRWDNQEFILGRTESTILSDKKAVLLRVRDEDKHKHKDDPMGCLRLDLQRDKTGHIRGLTLVHGDDQGKPTTRTLHLDADDQCEVFEKLIPDVKAGMSSKPPSRLVGNNGNKEDGPLGRLRFRVQIVQNENFIDPDALTRVPVGMQTKFSLELCVDRAVLMSTGASASPRAQMDWSKYTCVFQPHGKGGQRVHFDVHSEDMASGMTNKLSDLLVKSSGGNSTWKVLGRTYDVAKVDYFDVTVVAETGSIYQGKWGNDGLFHSPDKCTEFNGQVVVLKDRDGKTSDLHLTVNARVVALHRTERVRRLLAETFRIVGLKFDAKTATKDAYVSVDKYLADVGKANVFPGTFAQELLRHVHRMSQSAKLHWKYTPQVLSFVFEHVFFSGENEEKDHMAYADAVALDNVLNRWQRVLNHVSDAKDQLIGHLHGRDTPRLLHMLFTECDWTGFEFASLLPSATASSVVGQDGGTVFRDGQRVHAFLPPIKYAGVAVDVKLPNGNYVPGTITREYGDGTFSAAFCAASKVREEGDEYFSDDEELPPLDPGQSVYVCPEAINALAASPPASPTAAGKADAIKAPTHAHCSKPGRSGRVKRQDAGTGKDQLYLIEYDDQREPREELVVRAALDTAFIRVVEATLQLRKDDFVRVLPEQDVAVLSAAKLAEQANITPGAVTGSQSTRPARVVKNLGNSRYDVVFLDLQNPKAERVPRERLLPLTDKQWYGAEVAQSYLLTQGNVTDVTSSMVRYDIKLANGTIVEGLPREVLRADEETFASDNQLLAAVHATKLAVADEQCTHPLSAAFAATALEISELWGMTSVMKVYVVLPDEVKAIHVRDAVTNKLRQVKLHLRDNAKPRFMGQLHGYTTGDTFSQTERAKLAQIYMTKVLADTNATMDPTFAPKRCLCLYVAPTPQAQVSGQLHISPLPGSIGLFKSLLQAALKQPMVVNRVLQQQLRYVAQQNMALNRKERYVTIDRLDVYFHRDVATNVTVNSLTSTCDGIAIDENGVGRETRKELAHVSLVATFAISVPHNDRGSLAEALTMAKRDAGGIIQRLDKLNVLRLLHDTAVNVGSIDILGVGTEWDLDTTEAMVGVTAVDGTAPDILRVMCTGLDGELDLGPDHTPVKTVPSLSLELLPLNDLRLSVTVATERKPPIELCVPIQSALVEARLRRELLPLEVATVISGPHELREGHPQRHQRNVAPDRHLPQVYKLQLVPSSGRSSPNKKASPSRSIEAFDFDLRRDTLTVRIIKASDLFTKDNTVGGNVTAEVTLVSSDFDGQDTTGTSLRTPFNVVLDEQGEICKDLLGHSSPREATMSLTKVHEQLEWTASTTARVSYGYPSYDLKRVAAVVIRVKAQGRVVGQTRIPLSDVTLIKPGAVVDPNMPKEQRVFSLFKDETDHKNRVVGKIMLEIERAQVITPNSSVMVRKLMQEDDHWLIASYELLALSLHQQQDKLLRGLLASTLHTVAQARTMLEDPLEKEVHLQRIKTLEMMALEMDELQADKANDGSVQRKEDVATTTNAPPTGFGHLAIKDEGKTLLLRGYQQIRYALLQTTRLMEDTAADLGFTTTWKRLPWSSEPLEDPNAGRKSEVVLVPANLTNSAHRVRRTVLKLYHMYRNRLIPTLDRLYELDAMGDHMDVKAGEQLLNFFEEEVEDLEEQDQVVYRRVYQRLRLVKIAQVMEDIMQTTLRVTVMDEDRGIGNDDVGTAFIPAIDLLDQVEHYNQYQLYKTNRSNEFVRGGGGYQPRGSNLLLVQPDYRQQKSYVVLKVQLTYSESSLLEQATQVYKYLKAKFLGQHEHARLRINAAVVPAQKRRWATIEGYLLELEAQRAGKLHWVRTPVLLDLVWDIFVSHSKAFAKKDSNQQEQDEEEEYLMGLSAKAERYRATVVDVHTRWANLQPKLEELLEIQAARQIHATRTPQLLEEIAREVEGLDVLLSTAWQQVHDKWMVLYKALEELVGMKERKLHMGRAPQLLKLVDERCKKGLNERHAEGVANVQFRWMAITHKEGPLCELRLMEKKGLHWQRTHELVLLLHEQCEEFAEVDARALGVVQSRWEQLQEWLDDIVDMQLAQTIDCQKTPFVLKKMSLLEVKRKLTKLKKHQASVNRQMQSPPGSPSSSPRRRIGPSGAAAGMAGAPPSPPPSPTARVAREKSVVSADVEEDVERLEGMVEWYALEEAKRELERIPYFRLRTDHDRTNWLPYSENGKDTRLHITKEDMAMNPRNVREALMDRGVIPRTALFLPETLAAGSPRKTMGGSAAHTTVLPRDLLEEIHEIEQAIENRHVEGMGRSYVDWNPERLAELYTVIEGLGKNDLLWKVEHAVNMNRELAVPTSFIKLLEEMRLRQIPTGEIEDLVRTLTVVLQKEELLKIGVDVPPNANFTTVLALMHRHQVKDVLLPMETSEIQARLQERGMDKKGDPVYLRGVRIGTQNSVVDEDMALPGASGASGGSFKSKSEGKAAPTLNTGLGIIDTQIEVLRKTLLMEALRKRNSLIKTFPCESRILTDDDLRECNEVDMSGDYLTQVERFQQLLLHEAYTHKLSEYAALDRCMRGLVHARPDEVVTKEDMALALHALGPQYRLPIEAFTREELLEAASEGRIRTPTEQMLRRCPRGKNAEAMAYYAALSYSAMIYQEVTSFHSRVEPTHQHLQDALMFEQPSTVDGVVLPRDPTRQGMSHYVADWLLGSEDTPLQLKRTISDYHRQRLLWSSAAFTLRNRWFQRGYGWCDDATTGAGVKVLLQRVLLFDAANKMHMVDTEALLREVHDKCINLRLRESQALDSLLARFRENTMLLEELVQHAERCINNRKLHTERTPDLLHQIEQLCVVPRGLNPRHVEAYHVVTSHWIPHRKRLEELVQMQKQGTFSIHRTPELLTAMDYHTEGVAGSDVLDEQSAMAAAAAQAENQQEFDLKVDEIRRGQRKASYRLDLDGTATVTPPVAGTGDWQSLSPSKRTVKPLSPLEKQTTWKIAETGDAEATKQAVVLESKAALDSTGRRRKSSLGDELKELIKSPSKWLMATTDPPPRIQPEIFFPKAVSHDSGSVALPKQET